MSLSSSITSLGVRSDTNSTRVVKRFPRDPGQSQSWKTEWKDGDGIVMMWAKKFHHVWCPKCKKSTT